MVAVAVLGLAGTGAIAQGVSFSGSAGMGVKYTGDMENDAGNTTMKSTIDWISDFDIAISASGTTDGGLTFGASTAVEAGHASSVVTDSEVYIGGESWQVKIGDLDPASHMGRSLGDVGFDGLGVDDVAEKAVTSTHADVEVSFSLGAASLAITAGQTPGAAYKKGTAEYWQHYVKLTPKGGKEKTMELMTFTNGSGYTADRNGFAINESNLITFTSVEPGSDLNGAATAAFSAPGGGKDRFYQVANTIYRVNGSPDKYYSDGSNTVSAVGVDYDHDGDSETAVVKDVPDTKVGEIEANSAVNFVAGSTTYNPASDTMPATKQKTVWATGVSFAIGSTTLGIGIDSEKLMQASVSADLGAFSGKLFYAQQKMNEGKVSESKNTGMGVEIGVSAGENTTINAVYAQGKTDYKMASKADTTDKGFGVGVSHGLGGGATLNAGFAKVEDVSKASVGVSMSF